MRKNEMIVAILLTIPLVFILSILWEFFVEPNLFGSLDGKETFADRIEFVLTSTAFSAIALLIPMVLLLRMHQHWTAAQHQLRHVTNTAYQASRTKSLFLANVSHELRTPLNAIIGFSEVIKNEMLGPIANEKYGEYVDDIYWSGVHLLTMIDDLLDLTAAEDGQLKLQLETVDMADVVNFAAKTLGSITDEKNITARISFERDPALVHADLRRTKQVALTLLANAVTFSPKGAAIDIDVKRQNGGAIALTVTDNGPGMSKESRDQALKPFEHTPGHVTDVDSGRGLGLPLAAKLVAAMNGSLQLDSALGKGTTARIILPKAQ